MFIIEAGDKPKNDRNNKEVELRNNYYLNIKKNYVDAELSTYFNVIYGYNGSGKTSLINMLYLGILRIKGLERIINKYSNTSLYSQYEDDSNNYLPRLNDLLNWDKSRRGNISEVANKYELENKSYIEKLNIYAEIVSSTNIKKESLSHLKNDLKSFFDGIEKEGIKKLRALKDNETDEMVKIKNELSEKTLNIFVQRVNETLEELHINVRIDDYIDFELDNKGFQFKNPKSNEIINYLCFSTGEGIILEFVFKEKLTEMFKGKPALLLFDEYDAGLHPEALEILISKIRKYCEENHILGIFTTHNPLTVALNDSVYELENNKLSRKDKYTAYKELTNNISPIFYFPEKKIVYVEAKDDKLFYEKISTYLEINKLIFISVTGKHQVINTTNIHNENNVTCYGIVGKDNDNIEKLDQLKNSGIYAPCTCYSLENYILNPLNLFNILEKEKIIDGNIQNNQDKINFIEKEVYSVKTKKIKCEFQEGIYLIDESLVVKSIKDKQNKIISYIRNVQADNQSINCHKYYKESKLQLEFFINKTDFSHMYSDVVNLIKQIEHEN